MKDNQLVKEKKSRKKVGAAENNRNEAREIISNAKAFADGIYVVVDKGDNKIYVDTKKGLTAQLILVEDEQGNKRIDYKWYQDGATSSKANGYVYTPLIIDGLKGTKEVFMCATHTLVALLAHTDEYDAIDSVGKTPICNHKNNCPWDNRAENLEWCLQGGNTRHGKIVYAIHKHYDGEYTSIMNNLSDTDFVVLDQCIGIKDIERYVDYVGNKSIFKVENNGIIGEDVISDFVDWLKETGVWFVPTEARGGRR